jgi:hypothetical protein
MIIDSNPTRTRGVCLHLLVLCCHMKAEVWQSSKVTIQAVLPGYLRHESHRIKKVLTMELNVICCLYYVRNL